MPGSDVGWSAAVSLFIFASSAIGCNQATANPGPQAMGLLLLSN
jgi:hypothetical protein